MKKTVMFFPVLLCLTAHARAENAITRVGAINWDCSRPSTTVFGSCATRSLGPSRFRDRTPYYAKIVEKDKIDFVDRTVEEYSLELQYAIDAGIDYFAYCWYDRAPCTTHLDSASETACADAHVHELARARLLYERSPLRHKLNYCAILVACHQHSDAELRALAAAMKEPYYEKIGTRPLVYFFMGKVAGQLGRLRRLCREVGAGDPYAVLMVNKPTLPVDDDLSGIQAYGAYATGGLAATYEEVAERTIQRNAGRAALGKPTIPLFSCGWDPTPRIQNPVPWGSYARGTYPSPATAAELVSAAARLRRWVGENAAACPTGHVLAFAWNEFEEGGWICPNIGADGKADFTRRDAFASAVAAMKSRRCGTKAE